MDDLPDRTIAKALSDTPGIAVVISSVRGVRYLSRGFERLTHLTSAELLGRDLVSLVHPDSRTRFEHELTRRFEGARSRDKQEILLVGKEGELIWAEHVCQTIEHNGELLVVSSFVDIGDRRRLEDALAVSEERYRWLFDEDFSGRLVTTPDWRIVESNPALAQMLGSEGPSQLVGHSLAEFTADAMVLQKLVAITRAEGRAGPFELPLDRLDGGASHASCSVVGKFDTSGELIFLRGQLVEATESKRLQTRLLGAQRMEAVGRLAGGLAHDFNNLLTVIGGHSERLLDALVPHDPLRGSALAIQQASARAASLTRQLLAFSRRQVFELRPVAVHRLVMEAQPLLTKILGDPIALRLEVPGELPDIKADARQIEYVLVNLALNARDAMATGGTLTIRVDATEIAARALRERPWLRPGRYVRVVVVDTGPGMDPLTKAHAFQPFFTTKQMGNGSGLGLATVYGIIKQSNGFVWVDSEIGSGAAFTLLFPVLETEASEPSTRRAWGSETILVVEKDERVRTFVCDALRRRGYQVLDAPSGAEALGLFAAHPSRVHLMLSDVTSETANGSPLEARLKSIDPTIQSLFMLESVELGSAARTVLPGTPVIQKPFTLQALADKVREVFDSGEGRG
jgi:PAS domain S-box-containing protein